MGKVYKYKQNSKHKVLAKCLGDNSDGVGGCGCEWWVYKFQSQKVLSDVRMEFLECPDCGKRYISSFVNDDIKEWRKRLQRLKGSGISSINEMNQLEQKIKQEQQRIKDQLGIKQ